MSSGVRISGMNSNLDTEAIVEALVSAKKEKLNTFKGEQKKLEWKQDAWKSLNASWISSTAHLTHRAPCKTKTFSSPQVPHSKR